MVTRSVFGRVIILSAGLAGRFTRQQLAALYECAGPEGIVQLTQDNQVRMPTPHSYTCANLETEVDLECPFNRRTLTGS
jgi:hypothetical protein